MSDPLFDVDEGDEEAEGWLISYADLMTLIACFFILMMAFANYDAPGFQKKSEVISEHFKKSDKEEKREQEQNQEVMIEDKLNRKADVEANKGEMAKLKETLESKREIKKMTKIEVKNKQLILNFNGNVLFESGEYKIKDINLALIDAMISIIKDKNPNYRVLVEGHTDGLHLGEHSIFTSNWALSGARASSVAERFELYGFPPKSIKVVGYGSSKPLKPNRDKKGNIILENLKINRRVIVKILEPVGENEKVKLGLGVYFEDEDE